MLVIKLTMAEFHLAACAGVVHADSLSHCHGSLGYFKRTVLMLIITPVLCPL